MVRQRVRYDTRFTDRISGRRSFECFFIQDQASGEWSAVSRTTGRLLTELGCLRGFDRFVLEEGRSQREGGFATMADVFAGLGLKPVPVSELPWLEEVSGLSSPKGNRRGGIEGRRHGH